MFIGLCFFTQIKYPEASINASNQDIIKNNNILDISFQSAENTGLAIFKRGKYQWIVLDNYQEINIDNLRDISKEFIDEVLIIPNSQALIIRIKLKENIYTLARKSFDKWTTTFSKIPISFSINNYYISFKENAYLSISQIHDSNIISFIDPEIGDTITIIPDTRSGIGFSGGYKFPDFEILPTIQGLALVSNTDDIMLESSSEGINIKAHNRSLNISKDWEVKRHDIIIKDSPIHSLPISEFLSNISTGKNFVIQKRELITNIQSSPSEYKNYARIELAGYYLSMGLGTNALTVLKSVISTNSTPEEQKKIKQLLGIANFLAGKFDTAARYFTNDKTPETDLWINIINSCMIPDRNNFDNLSDKIDLLTKYPSALRAQVAKALLPATIIANDAKNTDKLIKILNENSHQTDAVSFFTAKSYQIKKQNEEANNLFKKLMDSKSIKYSALSRKELIDFEYKNKIANIDEIISEYEKLQYLWGESSFKIEILLKLADLYEQQQNHNLALISLQKVLHLVPGREKPEIVERMVKLFDIFYHEKIKNKSYNIKDLAFYYEYQWLAKLNTKYNLITMEIIKRLISLDLIDRAEKLAIELVESENSSNDEYIEATNYMALILLMKNNPAAALDMLDKISQKETPERLNTQQLIIGANSVLILGESKERPDLFPTKRAALIEILNKIRDSEIDAETINNYDLIKTVKRYKQNLINGTY